MLHLPPLYPITDAASPEPLSAQIRRLGEAGFPLVQFRGKLLDAKAQWLELHVALAEAAANGGWPFICVNDRTDLAMLAAREGLAPWGLHLGQGDLPAAEATRLPGLGGCHIGASTHSPAEWDAVDAACDHAGVGPFRGTATKSDHAEPIGLDGLRVGCTALRARGLAPIAIGGLGPADAKACFEAGAEALAMVGELQRSTDPATLGWEIQQARWQVRPPFRRDQGIVLLGGSGAGKSTLGRLLARRLGLAFHDLDDVIEANQGVPVRAIFAELGESAFRALESTLLPGLLAEPGVVALGGGAWEAPVNRDRVAAAGFVPLWLAEPPVRAWERVGRDPQRPLAQDRSAFMARCATRATAWSLAPVLLPFGRGPEDLASAMMMAW
ncbi:thiamine phosphate synthase [Geothrix fuzhouensis]|uniref:thiamine phosphate synthase n=1 Tax=Geothrix fuzhouensis TaxID=2966451 RepID=UPI0021481CEA|nr:thiamine phosphate synthase [Geothrix fuzhouensis]